MTRTVSGGLIYADTMEGQENQLWIGNAIGAVAGAIGGFFGSIIGGGSDASAKEIAEGTVGGAIAGAINPVNGVGSAVAIAAGGLAAGAVKNVADDM